MENVTVEGASGMEVDPKESSWKTSTWTQEITYDSLYLEVSFLSFLNDILLTVSFSIPLERSRQHRIAPQAE